MLQSWEHVKKSESTIVQHVSVPMSKNGLITNNPTGDKLTLPVLAKI